MKIWVDADAIPAVMKDIICRAAERKQIDTIFVANQFIRTPPSKVIRSMQVSSGFDVADDEIVKRVEVNDLVITSDIPLAAEVIAKGGQVLSSRGELFTKDNIRERLNIRDFMDTMRASGQQSGGPPPLNQADRQQFANHLDRILAKI
ncbi:MAG: YaiI/YqxD family protein [Paraglaciecola sp.]|uniref:YaiI/YqxD family protein n=1 Tax=Pseudomonadati TaxID=3379134 RepID=UPI002740190F|nr:YaiI/YqxD family protein [Paraglaciecola sp.]MDP5032116.1 YaiI/YqxD family protein [Paraglaciecola sp.]MDP5131812.1 YaiI/YqxD family protein [Paraglaciecola sp.]